MDKSDITNSCQPKRWLRRWPDMTPPPRVLLAAALATTLTVGVAIAASTPAAPLLPDHVAVLAGSPTRLVYADYPMAGKAPDYSHGALHVLTDDGRDRNLGGGVGNTDPDDPAHYSYSIVGTSITAYSTADPTQVAWWDLAARSHGIGTLPAGATWEGSAPTGWLLVESDRVTVATESSTGVVTSLGQPVPAESAVTGAVESVAGPSGVVSVGTTSGTAAFQTWDAPQTLRPLDLGADAGSPGLECGDASRAIAACVDRGVDGTAATELAVPLDGTAPHVFAGCGATPIAVKTQAAWLCASARPALYFGGREPRRARAHVSATPLTAAFGRVVTTGPREEEIIAVRNATTRVHVMVAIPTLTVRYDDADLRSAAAAVQQEALDSGALKAPSTSAFPAQVLQAASDALIRAARAKDPSLQPADTRSVMGAVPGVLRHHTTPRARHRHRRVTRSLRLFSHGVPTHGSAGLGLHRPHGGSYPAPFRTRDGVYVQPRLAMPANPTIGMVALRSALLKIGLPYVWAAAGPDTFDCSGLVQWAYAHAGIKLIHYTGSQYQEGRLLKPKQILPGDLILFDHMVGRRHDIHHVGIYVGAGWMVNAPYTGQYVNVVRVPGSIAGIVRP